MHLYLVPWVENKRDGGFAVQGMDGDYIDVTVYDMRPDPLRADGYGLAFAKERRDTLMPNAIYAGQDGDWDTRSNAVRNGFQSRLGYTAQENTPRGLMKEYLIQRVPHFRPTGNKYDLTINGVTVFDVPIIAGGVANDSFDRTDAGSLGTFSDAQMAWNDVQAVWEISGNTAVLNSTADYKVDTIDTDLDSSAHYAQAKCLVGAADFNYWIGVALRHDGSATMSYYSFSFRVHQDVIWATKMVAGTPSFLANAAYAMNTGSVHYIYADFGITGTANQYTVKADSTSPPSTTRLGPTSNADQGTSNLRSGIWGREAVVKTQYIDDFETGPFTGGGGGVTVKPWYVGWN